MTIYVFWQVSLGRKQLIVLLRQQIVKVSKLQELVQYVQ